MELDIPPRKMPLWFAQSMPWPGGLFLGQQVAEDRRSGLTCPPGDFFA